MQSPTNIIAGSAGEITAQVSSVCTHCFASNQRQSNSPLWSHQALHLHDSGDDGETRYNDPDMRRAYLQGVSVMCAILWISLSLAQLILENLLIIKKILRTSSIIFYMKNDKYFTCVTAIDTINQMFSPCCVFKMILLMSLRETSFTRYYNLGTNGTPYVYTYLYVST